MQLSTGTHRPSLLSPFRSRRAPQSWPHVRGVGQFGGAACSLSLELPFGGRRSSLKRGCAGHHTAKDALHHLLGSTILHSTRVPFSFLAPARPFLSLSQQGVVGGGNSPISKFPGARQPTHRVRGETSGIPRSSPHILSPCSPAPSCRAHSR